MKGRKGQTNIPIMKNERRDITEKKERREREKQTCHA
jgi:hypothetical protein